MDCKVELYLTKDKFTGNNLFVFKSPLITMYVSPDYGFKKKAKFAKDNIEKFLCKLEDIYPENLYIFYDVNLKLISVYTDISWKLRNLKESNLDAYNQISQAIDDILDYIADNYGYNIVRKSRFITVEKNGVRILIIDTNDFSLVLPCKLDYTNPLSYNKVLRCFEMLDKLKSLELYNKLINKAIQLIKEE